MGWVMVILVFAGFDGGVSAVPSANVTFESRESCQQQAEEMIDRFDQRAEDNGSSRHILFIECVNGMVIP